MNGKMIDSDHKGGDLVFLRSEVVKAYNSFKKEILSKFFYSEARVT